MGYGIKSLNTLILEETMTTTEKTETFIVKFRSKKK